MLCRPVVVALRVSSCVSTALSHVARLVWLCDVAELVRAHEHLDWERVIIKSEVSQSKKALLVSMVMAQEVLHAPVPARVLDQARASLSIVHTAARLQSKLFHIEYDPRLQTLDEVVNNVRMQDRATGVPQLGRSHFSLSQIWTIIQRSAYR